MFTAGGKVVDFDLEFLESISAVIDAHLDKLDRLAEQVSDPDALGVYDRAEEVYGIGFVVCQRYLAAIYGTLGVKKPQALRIGPRTAVGLTVAQAVNHAANYWKHHDEWRREEKRGADTKRAIEKFGFKIGRDYVLSCVFASLTSPPHRLKGLVRQLEAWREDLRKCA
jgi:hypothetical protein